MTFERSRCSVMRCRSSSCRRCADACEQGAITLTPAFSLSAGQCTGCLRCSAACPSGALAAPAIEHAQLHFPASCPTPVIGCRPQLEGCNTQAESQGHITIPCFGGCREEWLLVLALSLPDTVQLNLTQCHACHNGHILDTVKRRLEQIVIHTGIAVSHKIIAVEDSSDLRYEAVRIGRRQFFRAFGVKVFRDIQKGIPSRLLQNGTMAYNHKTLPSVRRNLNSHLLSAPKTLAQRMLRRYYYTVDCSDACTMCAACVAICPTGALEQVPEKHRLRFNPLRCTGCGVCAEFCRQDAIQVNTGWFHETVDWREL